MSKGESTRNFNKSRKYNIIMESKKHPPKIAIPLSKQLERFKSNLKPAK